LLCVLFFRFGEVPAGSGIVAMLRPGPLMDVAQPDQVLKRGVVNYLPLSSHCARLAVDLRQLKRERA
jgi:hypothetical protein